MLKVRLSRVPAAVVLAMIAIEAGLDPALVWEIDLKQFVDRVMGARARRFS